MTLFSYPAKAEAVLQELENHGYPFASIRLENVFMADSSLQLQMVVDSNQFILFDSIVFKGDAKLSTHFLYPYLGLRRGTPYNERQMRAVDALLAELLYTALAQPSGVEFVKDKAYLYIYLNEKKINQFDGYIGLIPNDEKSGKVSVNGEVTLNLHNIFRIGEALQLHWYSSERYSQHLQLAAHFPYLFRTRFGIQSSFQLDKQDTSYLTMNYHVGIPYAFHSNDFIEPYFDFSSSTILNPELIDFSNDSIAIDYRKSLWGLSTQLRKVDYLLNPRKGLDFSSSVSVGRRTILPNSRVDAALYEGMNLQKNTWRMEGSLRGYVPICKHWVIAARLQAGSLLSGPHYSNELFHLGGEEGIRGFNTNEILASTYLLYTAELRFLFGKNSFVNLFFDGGNYEKQLHNLYLKDNPFGFGAGVHIAVKSGILYLEYALGRQLGNPIALKSGKIHLGVKVSF